MNIVYIHHAERDIHNKNVPRQEQDITEDGKIEAALLSKKVENIHPTAIYTSPYKRCVHTSEILNQKVQIPIIYDERLNEYDFGHETFKEFLERNMNCISDIIGKYDEDDTVLCVTSGVNLSAFMCYFSGCDARGDSPRCQGLSISPVLFSTDRRVL